MKNTDIEPVMRLNEYEREKEKKKTLYKWGGFDQKTPFLTDAHMHMQYI